MVEGLTLFEDPAARAGATMGSCGTYRYALYRRWALGAHVLWIMANPSMADAWRDDPTLRRCCAIARIWGFGAVEIVNMYAVRSSHPSAIVQHPDPVGPHNDYEIARAIRRASAGTRVVVAWGSCGIRVPGFRDRERVVIGMLRAAALSPLCLGVTAEGFPKHPLARGRSRVPDDFVPVPYRIE